MRGLSGTGFFQHGADNFAQRSLGKDFVDITYFFGYYLVEEYTAYGGFKYFFNRCSVAVIGYSDLNVGMQVNPFLIVGNDHLFG